MKAAEFKRKVARLAKRRNLAFGWDEAHGKGSHGTLTFGTRSTILKHLKKELGIGLLNSMCDDRGISKKDLNDV